MLPYLEKQIYFGNASSNHFYGKIAKEAIIEARSKVAMLIGVDNSEIIWTSGATESNNLAIKSVFEAKKHLGKHIITSAIEHQSVLQVYLYLQRIHGARLTIIRPDINGLIDPNKIEEAVQNDTVLISIMHVNNEIGTIQKISEIGKIARRNNIIFHVDAAQSIGKINFKVNDLDIDLLSLSAHKFYGPKGIGCLFIKENLQNMLSCQIHGGGQENDLRSGTYPTHQIVGMGEACSILENAHLKEIEIFKYLSKKFIDGIENLKGIILNGDRAHCVPNIINVSFQGVEKQNIFEFMSQIAVSNGSACSSEKLMPSNVLQAMGLCRDVIRNAIRFSFGRYTTEEDIHITIEKIKKGILKI